MTSLLEQKLTQIENLSDNICERVDGLLKNPRYSRSIEIGFKAWVDTMVEAYKLAETEEQKNYLTTELNICRMYLGASLEKGIIKPPEDTDDLIPDL